MRFHYLTLTSAIFTWLLHGSLLFPGLLRCLISSWMMMSVTSQEFPCILEDHLLLMRYLCVSWSVKFLDPGSRMIDH